MELCKHRQGIRGLPLQVVFFFPLRDCSEMDPSLQRLPPKGTSKERTCSMIRKNPPRSLLIHQLERAKIPHSRDGVAQKTTFGSGPDIRIMKPLGRSGIPMSALRRSSDRVVRPWTAGIAANLSWSRVRLYETARQLISGAEQGIPQCCNR
ncbi:hypothetical protein BDW62DRAFT_115769 [Aspergillus aurantiobrunneus]